MDTVKFEKGKTLAVAHRGVSGLETENTAAAFVAAGNRSYYGVETDMRKTADGKFIVCHDRTLVRTAGENFNVEEVSLEVVQSVCLFDNDGIRRSDLRIPTLEEYIRICKKYGKHCVLELKGEYTDEDTADYIEIIRSLGYLDQVTFISFNYENLKKVRAICPDQSVQFLFCQLTDELFDRMVADKFDVDVHHVIVNEEMVKRFHSSGMKINCFTVDDKARAEELASLGVDFVTTNILE